MESPDHNPYLKRGIIAYIGNKRRLLGLIGEALVQVSGISGGNAGSLAGLRFADLFSGSGIVSRYARLMGMRVYSNDWEPYARVLARAWLEPRPGDIERLFGSPEGLNDAISRMNSLPVRDGEDSYLSRYYSPASENPDEADYRRERLFYTRQNAQRLDAARNYLEKNYRETSFPERSEGRDSLSSADADLRFCILLAPILYAAATHVNTSGVFKAFHKGFGGHGKDALTRITAPIEFHAPDIIDAPPGTVFSMDAAELAGSGALDDTDVAYLDPPYNQHQYGSNYHMLNTLVRWDRIPEPLLTDESGKLLRKAGIRKDWVKTRSPYCSKSSAEKAFAGLLDTLKAPLLLLSYSTDGIIPFERLLSLCGTYGKVRLCANPYVTYRGGRQSLSRKDGNLEFVLIVEKGRKTRPSDRREIERVLLSRRLQLAAKDLYRPEAIRTSGTVDDPFWYPELPGSRPEIRTRHMARIVDLPPDDSLSDEDARALISILDAARCRSRDEELEVIEGLWRSHPEDCRDFIGEIPRILRKMAHRKYQAGFEKRIESMRNLGQLHPQEYERISLRIDEVEKLARTRFAG